MKRLLLLALAAAFTACSPDIPQDPGESENFVEAEFDPAHSIIPLPNDLVFLKPDGTVDGKLHAPVTGGTDAQNEFNRDYLNLLDGFPLESTASMLFSKPIDVATVVPGTTLGVFDITDPAAPLPVTSLNITVADAHDGAQSLSFIPTSGYWTRGHRYGVLVRGGNQGIKGRNSNQTVTGSPTWALVTSSTPLVTCDTNGNNCILATSAIPTTQKDPAAQYNEQVRLAKQLEQLRLNYKPAIDQALATVPGLNRADIALFWTFTITTQPEVTFDPGRSIIPFPNDVLNPTGSQVTLPVPPDAGALTDLYTGLNTLDGFSTTAPIVTENGDAVGPLIGGKINPASIVFGQTGNINIVAAGPGQAALPTTPDGTIKAHACLNCPPIVMTLSDGGPILLPDGGPKPDTLAVIPDVPLTERTQYAIYVTTDLKSDVDDKNVIPAPAFALVRSSAPLFDGTHSTVSLLTDAQAAQLEPLRAALKPLFDTLAARGLPRTKVALAWAFTTQTTVTQLSQLHGIPFSQAAAQIPAVPLWVQSIPAPPGVPTTNVGAWFIGEIVDVFLLTDPRGVFDPTNPATPFIPFVMSVPSAAAPQGGYPVTIFGHGLTRTRTDGFILASALATAGQVMIAVDEPWHGDRNTCKGFGAFVTAAGVPGGQDVFACSNPATQTCNTAGRCQLANRNDPGLVACNHTAPDADKPCMLASPSQGHCAADDKCEGGAFASVFTPAPGVNIPVNGWNLLNLSNFFATRDNFRQQVVTHGQLARILQHTGTGNLGQQTGITIDATKTNYVGQSLGGVLGTLYSAVAPEVRNAALNVPGGDIFTILNTSPAFAPQKAAVQAALAAQGIAPNSPAYDFFTGILKWIIDPADPINAGPYLVRNTRNGTFPTEPLANNGENRRGYIQWIQDDQVIPNLSTQELIRSVVADPNASGVLLRPSDPGGVPNFWAKRFPTSGTPANNHGFLLGSAGVGTAQTAQGEIAGFVSGAAPF